MNQMTNFIKDYHQQKNYQHYKIIINYIYKNSTQKANKTLNYCISNKRLKTNNTNALKN